MMTHEEILGVGEKYPVSTVEQIGEIFDIEESVEALKEAISNANSVGYAGETFTRSMEDRLTKAQNILRGLELQNDYQLIRAVADLLV